MMSVGWMDNYNLTSTQPSNNFPQILKFISEVKREYSIMPQESTPNNKWMENQTTEKQLTFCDY